MEKSNLVYTLKRFSSKDWRAAKKFIKSPYFNARKDVILLFDFLEKKYHRAAQQKIDKEAMFKTIYPSESFDEKKLRHLMSYLSILIKKYFSIEYFQADTITQQKFLCQNLERRDLKKLLQKELKTSINLVEKESQQNADVYLSKFEVASMVSNFSIGGARKKRKNFQSLEENISIAFIIKLLKLGCEIQSHQTLTTENYELKLFPEILTLLKTGLFLNTPIIELYFNCYMANDYLEKSNTLKSEEHFLHFKKSLENNWSTITSNEVWEICMIAINYCIKRLNSGNKSFIREAFELYRFGLENKFIFKEGILSTYSYKNISRLGIALAENIWVEEFLKEHKKFLPTRERENTWRYNLAYFHFQQNNYSTAMRLLLQVEFSDPLNNLDARRILLKCYFELKEYDPLDSLLNSFKRYIYRQKEIGYHKENYLNLLRIVKKIIYLPVIDKTNIHQIKSEVLKMNNLVEREWLLEKVDELITYAK